MGGLIVAKYKSESGISQVLDSLNIFFQFNFNMCMISFPLKAKIPENKFEFRVHLDFFNKNYFKYLYDS